MSRPQLSHTHQDAPGGRPSHAARAAHVSRQAATCKVLLTTLVPDEKTAWSKARADAGVILRRAGYETLQLPWLASLGEAARFWSQLKDALAGGGHLLIEHPFVRRKRAYFLYLFRLLGRVKLYALVHDLDSLRFETHPRRELAVLRLFDGVISHNRAMSGWLRANGYTGKIVELQLFDYLSEPTPPSHALAMDSQLDILYAGNLTFNKASYIYREELGALTNAHLSVFGPYFDSARAHAGITHKGVFDPDRPVLDRRYHFGLVWEGDSLDGCDGAYGRYLRYNNPHKASLYIAQGLPIVIWRGAALADFVRQEGIGVAIDRLEELDQLASRVSNEAYLAMVEKVQALRRKVNEGGFLASAIERLVAS